VKFNEDTNMIELHAEQNGVTTIAALSAYNAFRMCGLLHMFLGVEDTGKIKL
jgi:hypothetical protein